MKLRRSGCEYCRVTYRVFWLQCLPSEICQIISSFSIFSECWSFRKDQYYSFFTYINTFLRIIIELDFEKTACSPKGENETPQYVFLKLIVIQNKLQRTYSIPPRILNIWNIWQNDSLAFSFQITFSSHFTFAMFADRLRQNGFRKHILLFYLHFVL